MTPEAIHSGVYPIDVTTHPIKGFTTNADNAPAVPDNPTTVEVAAAPNVSAMDVM